ncbi:hypothetical protein C3747_110g68 [Trypanosoma cruzi]|uniref:Abnormal spindle-like microcephaly-associated protein ASH domain-containing protein n=1 Tax=Trypanosoma cruzi TaxID=5693 RepID=A0A2V2WDV0_TRYCR|nr:hypothetical protein C3747_110g68 [Trypanosoma cruzi]
MPSLVDNRDRRRRKLGIDCVGRVVWRHWEPNNEYVKKIRIMNIDSRPQTIQYEQPLRKHVFLLNFPEPVTLSSGMSFDLEVRFRPTDLVELQDVVKVSVMGRGSFPVRLECQTPYTRLLLPPQHDFSYLAVGSTATHTVKMKNTGTVTVAFEWCVMEPFVILPGHGVIDEGESIELTLFFTPTEACALVAQAVCKMTDNNEVLASMKLSGIGKYPFIRLVEPRPPQGGNTLLLDFGSLLTATSRTKEFSLENPSMVDAVFALETADNAISRPFTITPATGVIRRGATQKFKVVFAPAVSGMVYVNAYRVVTPTGNTVSVQLRGVALAPSVHTSTTTIDFGDVRLGEDGVVTTPTKKPYSVAEDRSGAPQRFFFIKNASDMAQEFCFMPNSPGAVFVVEPVSGELPAKGSVRVKVEFHPKYPINYLRRLFILVKHLENLLYVDLFGTAYDSFTRPMPCKASDVEAFFLRHEYGLAGAQPEDLVAITDALRTGHSYEETACMLLASVSESQGPVPSQEEQHKGVTRKRKGRLDLSYLMTPFSANAPFCVGADKLVFAHDAEEPQHISVYNRTNAPAVAYWCIPRGCAFLVVPLQEEIPPHACFTFTVTMHADAYSPVSDQFLECYVNFKQMCSFRLVDEGGFTPPHFFTVRCQRELNINPLNAGTIAPLIHTSRSISFPACRADDIVHAVLDLENRGDVAVMFTIGIHIDLLEPKGKMESDTSDRRIVFSDPVHGIMSPKQRLPVVLWFLPKIAERFRGRATITLNHSPEDEIEVALCGESFSPELVVEDSSMIVLRPTCVTGEARRPLSIFNPTCIPITFYVQPSTELAHVLQVDPASGVLAAGQQMHLTLLFTPSEGMMYEGRINFFISHTDTKRMTSSRGSVNRAEEDQKNLISCPCTAEGQYAVVEVEPVVMQHEGPAMQEKTFEWTIYNSSLCDVCYEVRWLSKTAPTHHHDHRAPSVQLSHNKCGTLSARSHTVVLVTLRPQTGFSEYILYIIVAGSGVPLGTIPHPTTLEEVRQHPHCEVQLIGTRPAVQITDVGSLEQHRSQLWCQLAINSVNEVLAAPVQATDLETDSFAFLRYIRGLEPIFMDLGVGNVLDARKEVLLCFENAGSGPALFRFWDPTEHEGGNETWFLDDEELEDVQQLLCDRLLEISPREGTIPVGSQKVVTITYRHTVVGEHSLPVLLRLDEGKKALLVLEGRTVSPDANALAFHHPSVYNLHPVALGDLEPPLQSTTIENVAPHPVTYILQEDLEQRVAEKNCGFPVFQCLNPSGVIPAGGSAQLKWYFRPLEARTYSVKVSLRTAGGEDYSLQFVGAGYHPKKVPPETVRAMTNDAFLPIPVSAALRLPVERCPLTLSMNVMRVGAAPSFSLHRRLCYLENKHPTHTYSFLWKTHLEPGSSIMKVTPPSGVLGPGQKVRCCLSLYCGSLSQILETPIFCYFSNEATATAAEKGARTLEFSAAEGKFAESEAAEEDAFDDPLLDAKTPPGKTFKRSTCTKPRPPGNNRKRLPVTFLPSEDQSVRAVAPAASAAAAAVLTPTITDTQTHASLGFPEPNDTPVMVGHSLEVLVQARIMPIEEYEDLYGKRALQQMHFPTLCQNYVDPANLPLSRRNQLDGIGVYSSDEASVALRVLDGMLRATITRPQVYASFTEPVREDIPYYREMVHADFGPVTGPGGAVSALLFNQSESIPSGVVRSCVSLAEKADGSQTDDAHSAVSAMKPGETVRSRGAVINFLEEVLADVTLQAVGSVAERLQVSSRKNSKRVES